MIIGQDMGPQLAALLGMPKNVIWFELRCAVNEFVTIKCEYCPESGDFTTALAEFALVRKEPAAHVDPAPINFDDWMSIRTERAHAEYQYRMSMLSADDAIEAERRKIAAMRELIRGVAGVKGIA